MTAERWQVHTEDGFQACYRATFSEVYRYAAMLCGADRAAAEDLVQDVYLEALDRTRSGAITELSIGWLVTTARHRFIDHIRSSNRERRRLQLVASTPHADTSAQLPEQLAALPERERVAMVLRYVDDLSVAQIAMAMGATTHATESLIARATRRLRHREVS